MDIDQAMHMLVKRKFPEYNWSNKISHARHWLMSCSSDLDGFPIATLPGKLLCLMCGQYIEPGDNNTHKHAAQHLKEHNLLPLL